MSGRIGFDITPALTQGGGIGRYTRELIRALVEVDQSNHYRLFSARPPDRPPVPNSIPSAGNVTFHPSPFSEHWLYRLWYRGRLPIPVQLTTGKIDLFHSPDFVLPPTSGNIPTILTVHDLSFQHFPETFPQTLVNYLNKVVPWSIERATLVLADSLSTSKDLQDIWNVSPDKISVLYSGVGEQFKPVQSAKAMSDVRARYGLGDWPIILAVGTVQPRKNYGLLVRVLDNLAGRLPHHLVITGGKGWLSEGLIEEIDRRGLSSRVHLIGFVDDRDLPTLYSAADLFTFPSIYEGFGLPLLEAMACGTPVISSNASSLPEVANPNEPAAILLSPDDEQVWLESMLSLLQDEDRQHKLIAAGYQRAKEFSWKSTARQLIEIYTRLLS